MENVPMQAWYWVETTISSVVTWLESWSFHGIPVLFYLIGYAILSIMLTRIFR